LLKTWRMRNTGTCDWGTDVQFVFVKGVQMNAPAAVKVPPTAAGATADISVRFKAPDKLGTHRSTWRMRTADGVEFGDRPFVQINVQPPATDTPVPTMTPTPAPRADLDITLISVTMNQLVGQPVAMEITVRNHGPGATDGPAVVQAMFGPDVTVEGSVPSLPAGGQEVASIQHTFVEPVDVEVVVTVDPDDNIPEEDKENNRETVSLVVNPPLYMTQTITATAGITLDLDAGASEESELDLEWRVVEGTVYLGLLNDARAAPLSGEVDDISYALVAGLTWEEDQLALNDLRPEMLIAFRTSAGRIGYARTEAVLDEAHTSARVTYLLWDWP
jgi:hypothetical protein